MATSAELAPFPNFRARVQSSQRGVKPQPFDVSENLRPTAKDQHPTATETTAKRRQASYCILHVAPLDLSSMIGGRGPRWRDGS